MGNDEILLRTFPEGGRRIEQIEQLVRSLPGVYSARATEAPDGSLESIHVLTSDRLPGYRITRAIHSALLIYLDVAIDEDRISVGMTHDAEPDEVNDVQEIPLNGGGNEADRGPESGGRPKREDRERPPPPDVAEESVFQPDGSETVETNRSGPNAMEGAEEPPAADRTDYAPPVGPRSRPQDTGTASEPEEEPAAPPEPKRPTRSEEGRARGPTPSPSEHGLERRLHLTGYTVNADRGRGVEVRVRVGRGDQSFEGAVPADGGFASISREAFAEAAVRAIERALQRAPSSGAFGGLRFKIVAVEQIEIQGRGYLAVSISGPSASEQRSSAVGFAAIGQDAHGAAAAGALDAVRRLVGNEPSTETTASGSAGAQGRMDPFDPWS